MSSAAFHEMTPDRVDEFVRKGFRRRHFFPHRIYYLPKCGPDGFKLATSMCGARDLDQHWELVLYAAESLIDEFPRDLFFDDDLVWHQQHFGKAGQVATANLVLDDRVLRSTLHLSDLVQRMSRRREHKTRIENRFEGWAHMLLNGIVNFALEHAVKAVRTPTADLAIRNTDPARTVRPELYERVYDRTVQALFPARRESDWWTIDLDDVQERVVVPARGEEPLPGEATICVCHDIERGYGHLETDRAFAAQAHATSPQSLADMLAIEAAAGCVATYNVVGLLFDEVREAIEDGGHAVAFHSYDHEVRDGRTGGSRIRGQLSRWRKPPVVDPGSARQLCECRRIDYRIKGYRPPQSRITPELSDANLCFHNFEWLASSVRSLGFDQPRMVNRIAKLPILIDDFDLYRRKLPYERWEDLVVETLSQNGFGSVSLHDCYAPLWLPHYERLLERIQGLGRLTTMNGLASELALGNAA